MQFTTSLFAIFAALATLAVATPQGFGGFDDFGVTPFDENIDDNQNNNINQNDNTNNNEEFLLNEFESFSSIDNILDTFCSFDGESGELEFLGKRSDLVKRQGFGGFSGFPGFENFDFNNNQNANVNQNANLDENFLQSFDFNHNNIPMNNGDFFNGFSSGSIGSLIDCFFNEEGFLVAGKR